MEKYWMPKELDFVNLRNCLDTYTAKEIFIRGIGSRNRETKLKENLEGKILDFKKDKSNFYFLIDNKDVFKLPWVNVGSRENVGFDLAYERVSPEGTLVFLSGGVDPYDLELPEPIESTLRHNVNDYFIQIKFTGRVHLKFHSWKEKPNFKFWEIALKRSEPDSGFINLRKKEFGYNQPQRF